MSCQKCKSERVLSLSAKCSDMCGYNLGDKSDHGYAPYVNGICGGDYIEFDTCLDCGQIQGTFPASKIDDLE